MSDEINNPLTQPGDLSRIGNAGWGATLPQAALHIISAPRIRSVLYLTNDVVRIESDRPMPNFWVRFWHRALLGWRWEKRP